MRSRPVSSLMKVGGAYVLGGAKRCPRVSGPLFSEGGFVAGAVAVAGPGGDSEESVGDHGQGGVPVPGPVLADLVVVEAGLSFCLGKAVLDSPSGAGDRGE